MTKTHIIQGKARFFQALGKPRRGYGTAPGNGDLEWTFDLALDSDGIKDFLKTGASKDYVKERDGISYVRFTRKAVKKDGTEAKPIQIVDAQGHEWNHDILIGNDSVLNVAFVNNERSFRGKKFLKPSVLSVQVWEHQKYIPKNNFPIKPTESVSEENEKAETENW